MTDDDVRADLALTLRLLKWTAIGGAVVGTVYLVGRVAEWW
jgi:hypothetical protein